MDGKLVGVTGSSQVYILNVEPSGEDTLLRARN